MKKDKDKEVQSLQRDQIQIIPINLIGLNLLMTSAHSIKDSYAISIFKTLSLR